VTFRRLGTWRSPHTGALYPSGWIVSLPALRSHLKVEPSVKDQEMTVPAQPRASYWEGSGRVSGTFQGAPVTGVSYTELTGYAGT
jgi:predicted secreted hydrolase